MTAARVPFKALGRSILFSFAATAMVSIGAAGCGSVSYERDVLSPAVFGPRGTLMDAYVRRSEKGLFLMFAGSEFDTLWRTERSRIETNAVVEACREFLRTRDGPRKSDAMIVSEVPEATRNRLGDERNADDQTGEVYQDRHIIVAVAPIVVLVVPEPIVVWSEPTSHSGALGQVRRSDGEKDRVVLLPSGFEFGREFAAGADPSHWYLPVTGQSGAIPPGIAEFPLPNVPLSLSRVADDFGPEDGPTDARYRVDWIGASPPRR